MKVYLAKDHHGYIDVFATLQGAEAWLREMSHLDEPLLQGSSGIWRDESGECSIERMEVRP